MTETKGAYSTTSANVTAVDMYVAQLIKENAELRSEIARLNKIIDLQSQMLKAWENTKCT